MLLSKEHKIYVAGHNGMVGSAICRKLKKEGYRNIITVSRKNLDLRDFEEVSNWFKVNKPDSVFLVAAKVGGIIANRNSPTEFLIENIKIQNNIIENCWKNNIKRLLFLGSSCIYPKEANQPMKEEELLSGYLEETNESYALSKILGIKFCNVLRQQYQLDAISLMPTNLFGPGDNYDPVNSHVLASFIRKFCYAVKMNQKEVICWGTGNPMREFLHVDDLADACLYVMENWDPDNEQNLELSNGKPLYYLNVGTGKDITIRDLAQKIALATNYSGKIIWDESKPDGTPKKLLDISRINKLGWKPKIKFEDGLLMEIKRFRQNILS